MKGYITPVAEAMVAVALAPVAPASCAHERERGRQVGSAGCTSSARSLVQAREKEGEKRRERKEGRERPMTLRVALSRSYRPWI